MLDDRHQKDRPAFDVTTIDERIQALVHDRTGSASRPSLRQLANGSHREANEPIASHDPEVGTQPASAGATEAGVDPVNYPPHYTSHPSGVECITVTRWMNFNKGNAMKYLWRAGEKGNEIEDLRKARWYIDDEIARLEKLRDGQ